MQTGLDNDKMTETLEKAKKIIEDDMPYLCLMYRTYSVVYTTDLDGIVAPRFNDCYYACDDWKIRVYQDNDDDEKQEDQLADGTEGAAQQDQ